ncbi:hypothetical protein SEPCBS119000_005877 [Sporothrix epigloea]|uniref:Cell wall proline rich protein n=1 Tax=Sporothrix epigloea TaxID=1892477 RepID=A0ABP0E290_9PEZI
MEDAVTNDDDVASALRTVARKSSSSKKKKKARTWGILGRKSKPRRKSRRAPTPPPPKTEADSDSDELVDPHFTAMDPIIAEPPAVNELSATTADSGTPCGPPQTELRDDLWIWQPAQTLPPSKLDDDTSFAVIDMDAALGPFNTPLPRDAEWEAAQRAGGLSIRQLHSAAGMTRFSGPGMHYSHRRAESAPEMPPFNRSGISRFNNSTAMDDVFEEDEEEDDGNKGSSKCQPVEATAGKQKGVHSENLGICASPPDSVQSSSRDQAMDLNSTEWDDPALPAALSRRSSGRSETDDSSNDDRLQPIVGDKAEISASSLPNDVVVEEDGLSRFKFGDGYDFVMDSSSDSTLHLPGRLMKGKHLSQLDVSPLRLPNTGSPAPISPYTMAPSHVFESAPSSLSYDAGRILKAHSPVDKDNFESLLLGEPGPEVRVSSDIPSLTSSNSTMTRESTVPQAPQYPNIGGQPRPFLPSRVNERPASFTSTAFGRRRSSLASLHRLISTSHGERSKLSIEVQIDGGDASNTREGDKTAKSSKTKRISRMMQFWRGKDEATT